MKAKHVFALFLALCLTLPLLAACGGDEGGEVYRGEKETPFIMADDFTINIKDEAKKILRCNPVIWCASADFPSTLDTKLDIVKDVVIQVCRQKTIDDLMRTDIMTVLGDEITAALNETFLTEEVQFVTWSTFYYN